MDQDTKEFSPEELRKQDGRNGSKVLIAHQGSVYDVSENKLWKTGTHMKRHQAGTDLTDEIKGAPHGPEVLEKVPQVGTLTPEQDSMDENVPDLLLKVLEKIPMLRRHPHPMTVHFPIAFCLTVPLFNFLYLVTKVQSFETPAFYMLILSLLGAALALMSGPYAWWINYGAVMTGNIRVKLVVSSVLFVLLLACFFWRLAQPGVLHTLEAPGLVYFLLTCAFVPLVSVLGWIGAKMTFPH